MIQSPVKFVRLDNMNLFFTRVPQIIQSAFSQLIWVNQGRGVTLTFDDGPYPETTPWLLDYLDNQELKAIFFVVGEQAERHPELLEAIIQRGHRIGNHGYRHLNGWRLSVSEFHDNVSKGAAISGSNLFRPPYGKMGYRQYSAIKKDHQIMMWSVMPGDFVEGIHVESRMKKINRSFRTGDIIVMHDNPTHFDQTKEMLELLDLRH